MKALLLAMALTSADPIEMHRGFTDLRLAPQHFLRDECPHSVLCQPTPFQSYADWLNARENLVKRPPLFPGDLVVCYEDEIPGEDCNCVGSDEDTCLIVPWTSCDSDSDCEIKSQSVNTLGR